MAKPTPGCGGRTSLSKGFLSALRQIGLGETLRQSGAWAEAGIVSSLGIGPGKVVALVQSPDGNMAQVDLEIAVIPEQGWRDIEDALAAEEGMAKTLLSGHWPPMALDVIEGLHIPFLPGPGRAFKTRLYGDSDDRCIGAVCQVLAQRLDEVPGAYLHWLGRSQERFQERLQACLATQNQPRTKAPARPHPVDLYKRYWISPPGLGAYNSGPASGIEESIESIEPIRLPPHGFRYANQNASELFEQTLQVLSRRAQDTLTRWRA